MSAAGTILPPPDPITLDWVKEHLEWSVDRESDPEGPEHRAEDDFCLNLSGLGLTSYHLDQIARVLLAARDDEEIRQIDIINLANNQITIIPASLAAFVKDINLTLDLTENHLDFLRMSGVEHLKSTCEVAYDAFNLDALRNPDLSIENTNIFYFIISLIQYSILLSLCLEQPPPNNYAQLEDRFFADRLALSKEYTPDPTLIQAINQIKDYIDECDGGDYIYDKIEVQLNSFELYFEHDPVFRDSVLLPMFQWLVPGMPNPTTSLQFPVPPLVVPPKGVYDFGSQSEGSDREEPTSPRRPSSR